MISKKIYTKIFLNQIGKSTDEANIQFYLNEWWQNKRNKDSGGLRLSENGYKFLVEELKLQEHEIPFTDQIELSPSTIIFFDNFLDCPYYLTFQSLTVFSEKKAFELHLFSDDIRKYGLIKAINARKNDS
jgi:hypothetical protein